MTKEELEKEAEEWRNNYLGKNYGHLSINIGALIDVYLASAEPREKRIEELKARCMELFMQNNQFAEQLEYSKAIIKDLLDNSDEYAKQRAMDFLEVKDKSYEKNKYLCDLLEENFKHYNRMAAMRTVLDEHNLMGEVEKLLKEIGLK